MRTHKLLALLPAWVLVASLVALGSGWAWGGYYGYSCDGPCGYNVKIDVDQDNYGNGYNRTNFADSDMDLGHRWAYNGGKITTDQKNYGNGNTRDNVAYADIENGGSYGYYHWYWYGGNSRGLIDTDQENVGNGNFRDNAAFSTWSW